MYTWQRLPELVGVYVCVICILSLCKMFLSAPRDRKRGFADRRLDRWCHFLRSQRTQPPPGDDHVFAEYIWMSAVVVVVVLAPRSQEVSPQDLQGYREGLQGYQ